MKKLAAAFVSLGVILVIVGLVLVGIYGRDQINNGGIFSLGSPSLDSANTVFEQQPDEMQGLSQIIVSVADYNVYLLPSESDVLSVKYVDSLDDGAQHLYIDYSDGVLNVSQSGDISSHHWGFGWLTNRRLVAVYIPQNAQFAQVKVNVYADYSSINVDDIQCTVLDIKTSAGSIHLDKIVAQDVKLISSAGSIKIENVNAQQVSIETNAGSVKAEDSCCETFKISTDAGSVNVADINATTLADIYVSAGSVKCEVDTPNLSVSSKAGSIKFTTNASAIKISSKTGSVNGTIEGVMSEYQIDVRKDTGSSNISNQSVPGATKHLSVEVNTGSIHIDFDND